MAAVYAANLAARVIFPALDASYMCAFCLSCCPPSHSRIGLDAHLHIQMQACIRVAFFQRGHSCHLEWVVGQPPACPSKALLLWYNLDNSRDLRNTVHPGSSPGLTPELATFARMTCTHH